MTRRSLVLAFALSLVAASVSALWWSSRRDVETGRGPRVAPGEHVAPAEVEPADAHVVREPEDPRDPELRRAEERSVLVPNPAEAERTAARLVVRVVDAAGRPTPDVPVSGHHMLRGSTGADGSVVLLDEEAWREWPRTWPLWVGFAFPSPSVEPVPVDLEGDGAEVELVLPATGSVVVDAGVPDLDVNVSLIGTGVSSASGPLDDEGRVRFPWVELGLELVALPVGKGLLGGRRSFSGPTEVDEEVVVELELDQGTTFAWRLVGSDATPFTGQVAWEFGTRLHGLREPDERGVYEVLVALDERTLQRRVEELRLAEGERGAVVPLPPFEPGTRVDLGTLELTGEPLLVAGRVVTTDGAGLGGVGVTVKGVRGMRTVQTAADGSFRTLGRAEPGKLLGVAVVHPEFANVEVGDVVPGTTGLELVLERAFRVRVPVLFDARVLSGPNAPSLAANLRNREGVPIATAERLTDGALVFERASSGAFVLEAHLRGWRAPVVRLDVAVPSPGDGREEVELAPLDLRGSIALSEVLVRDDGGAPLAGARLRADWSDEWTTDEAGLAHVLWPGERPESQVVVDADGYVTTAATLAVGRVAVDLVRARRLVVSVVGGEPVRVGSDVLELELVRLRGLDEDEVDREELRRSNTGRLRVDPATRSVELDRPPDGRYRTFWHLGRQRTEVGEDLVLEASTPAAIDLAPPPSLWQPPR